MKQAGHITAALLKVAESGLAASLRGVASTAWDAAGSNALSATAAAAIPGVVVGGATGLFSKRDKAKTALRRALFGGALTGAAGGAYSLGRSLGTVGALDAAADATAHFE